MAKVTKVEKVLRDGGNKFVKVRHGRWKTLSTGEKVGKVIIKLALFTLKVYFLLSIGAILAGLLIGGFVAFTFIDAAAGAIDGEITRAHARRNRFFF